VHGVRLPPAPSGGLGLERFHLLDDRSAACRRYRNMIHVEDADRFARTAPAFLEEVGYAQVVNGKVPAQQGRTTEMP
jgi:hypothetical protein